jgi:hypothetical protein
MRGRGEQNLVVWREEGRQLTNTHTTNNNIFSDVEGGGQAAYHHQQTISNSLVYCCGL